MSTSKLFAHRVLNLIENQEENFNSPFYTNIDLFTDKGYDLVKDIDSPEFSIESIRNIVTKKGFSSVLQGDPYSFNVYEELFNMMSGATTYGMWFILSLLNHSCVGNIVRIVKGEVCVLKVFRDVKAGEELSFSYFDGEYNMTLQDRQKSLKSLHKYKCNCLLCKYESEPNITPLLAQVSTLYVQTKDFWSNYGCNSPNLSKSSVPLHKYKKIVASAIELADALGLGRQTFCGTLWSSFIDLTCIVSVPVSDQLFLFEKIQEYLCDLEVYHQHTYWKNYRLTCMETFGPRDGKTKQVELASVKFGKLFKWE